MGSIPAKPIKEEMNMKKKTLTYVLTGALSVGILGAIPAFAAEEDSAKTNDSAVVSGKSEPEFGGHRGGGHGKFHLNEEQVKEKAEELGIDSTDKDSRELAKEIMDAELEKRAKDLGIETEGKDHRALMDEIRQAELNKKAKELGIATDGKDQEELSQEVREALLKQKAKELGVETEGKELDELADEVREAALLKQAKDLGIESEGKEHHELKQEIFEASILKAAKELGIETEGKTSKELMEEIMTNHADEAKKLDFFPFNKEEGFFFLKGGKGHHGGPGHGKGPHESVPEGEQSEEPAAESPNDTL
jgi:inhibitor of KinA sporulation pathway (predicted exonuclease)